MKNFGVLVPVVTPCSRTGEIDLDGFIAERTGSSAYNGTTTYRFGVKAKDK